MSFAGASRPAPRGSAGGSAAAGGGGVQRTSSGLRPAAQRSGATPSTNGVSKPMDAQPGMTGGPHMGPAGMAAPPGAGGGAAGAMVQGQGNPYDNPMHGAGVSGYGNMAENYNGNGGGGAGDMGGMSGYGSMYGMGGGMGPQMGSMYGMGSPAGSMYGMGGGMGSMYGMGPPMGSMYGMGPPMGSMYGMGGPMGSMYGMGGPMGSTYGMGPPMGSMYGMGGPMGSIYGMGGGMGSMYGMARSMSFSSYGGGSLYGGMGGGSMMNLGGSTRSINGMWGTEYGYKVRSRRDNDMPSMAKMLKDDEEVEERHLVTATQKMLEKEGKGEKERKVDAGKKDEPKKEAGKEEAKDGKAKTASGKDDEKDGKRALAVKPDGTDAKGAAGSAEDVLDDTNAIRSIVVVEDAKSDRVKVEEAEPGHKVVIQGTAGKPVECRATDVLLGPEADVAKSSVLNMMASHVKSGHNVCLIAIDTKEKSTPLFTSATTAFFTKSLERLGAEDVWKAAFSATAISGPSKYRDLLTSGNAAPADIVFGSNPIFGPCIMDATQVELEAVAAVDKRVKEVLEKQADPQEMLFLQAVVHIHRGEDLFLCSISTFVLRSIEAAEAAAVLDDRRVPVPVMRTAIGGATRTAVISSITGAPDDAAKEGDVLRVAASIAAKENLSPRSGNVPRFIEYTEKQIAKIEKDALSLSGEAKERRTHMVEKMRAMANDAKELLANPAAAAKVYPIHTKSAGSSTTPAKDANAAAGTRDLPSPAPKNGTSTAAAAAAARRVPADPQQPVATTAAADPTASDAAAAADAPVSSTPFSSIHRLVYMQGATAAWTGKVVEVVVGSETKAYDVDECIDCPAGVTPQPPLESKELQRMCSILLGGSNVAVLGAEHLAPTQPQEQMTWRYVKHLLAAVLAPPPTTSEMTNEVSLHMSVLHERDITADLISGSTERRRLVVATSPLFGPMVHESAAVKVRDPQMMRTIVDKALELAASCMEKEGSLIVMTAVLKQIVKDDVRVASVFAVSAADMAPYKGVIERNPKYSRSLFTYALGGPASTALLISASHTMDQAELATSLSAQRSISHMKVPAPRNGSVKEFVRYARDSLERHQKRAAAITDTAEREKTTSSMRRLGDSLKDHEELLANPRTVEPRAYPPDVTGAQPDAAPPASDAVAAAAAQTSVQAPVEQRRTTPVQAQRAVKVQPREEKEEEPVKSEAKAESAEASQDKHNTRPVQCLVVITQETREGLQTKEGWSVEGAGNALTVTDVEGAHNFAVDEVALRMNRNTPIESTVLEELRNKFLEGQNVALVTADTRGSASSLEAVDRSVRGILAKLPSTSSLYVALCALKEQTNMVLDTLNEKDDYKPMEISTSPLFGPVVADASFRKVATLEDFVRVMNTGLRKCGESRACVVLQLLQVETKPAEADVCVNSFLGVMCPGDISVYRRALDQPVKKRGIFSLALGGSCHTVFMAGLTKNPADEGCLLLPRLAQAFTASVLNLKPRDNSIKRFVERTKGAAAQVQQSIERATSEEEKAKMQAYLETVQNMISTSEAYLADSADKIPPTYPMNNRPDRREL
ncbi:putative mitochondrial hypothetical protein [Leptomonas pyrrhocoris]|uniref:Uncharacterized protein n=1 Tax=Leptomonas pyrrhocoris TaxID=157538 RepID=A0A0N0DYT8_LEPPY|nr:putative mitochondrial hypothetical protein [Leptomonas pyrrhocoris]KPA84402.1 putative mitochondrial hypothetical protein [Leptomonas pyrrhocoris]|eukprot:XP_015662841.1 putative mitochondrial hypothetical protein [Leptomonas pyrrhocoris]